MTDRLAVQVWLSIAIAAVCAVSGYVLAAFGPFWLGGEGSVAASGMIAASTGIALAASVLLAPRHRIVARRWRGGTGGPSSLPAPSPLH